MQRGRPVLLDEKLDTMVQQYILAVRAQRGTIDTSVDILAANRIVKSLQRTQLVQYGGHVELTDSWARSLLNFTKRKGTTKLSMPPEAFAQLKMQFLQDIITAVEMEKIPPDLIINWKQTGLHVVPASSWTMALKGSKRIEIKGLNDERQITAIFGASILCRCRSSYTGKTKKCRPPFFLSR